ncbi:hypothetical protein HDE_13325 [Halotydeus destructor]|nr:hypothetical protein HDE_13325 [Halotydeus destructor]
MSISVAIFLVTMTTVVKGRPSSSEVENVAEALRYLEQIDKYYSQMARPRFGRSVHTGDTANKLDESQQNCSKKIQQQVVMVSQGLVLQVVAVAICSVLVIDAASLNLPANYDYDNIRDLYELLMRNDGYPAASQAAVRFGHQMERKGGRSPSLRLRFGKRFDPLWSTSLTQERPSDLDSTNHSS